MKVYVVYPSVRAGWAVLREGDADPLHFPDREAAIGYAQCLASANRPSALKVETAYGQVEARVVFERDGTTRQFAREMR
jgi:hypothetical protein